MNRRLFVTIGAMVVVACIDKSLAEIVPENQADLRQVSTGVNNFSATLFKTIATEDDKNLISSPVSVAMVLSMASFGARGDTEKQMRSALRLPSDDQISKKGYQSLIETLNSVKKVNLKLANKIFTRIGFEVKPEFKEITSNNFKSEIESIDFDKSDVASKTINNWCEINTEHRIKDIVQPGDLNGATLVLINAVYFKGNWKKKFDSAETSQKAFFTPDNSSKDVPMMQKLDNLNYGELDQHDAKFVEIEYESEDENDATSMIIVLPNSVDGLKKNGNKLNEIDFKQIRQTGYKSPVQLSLPKFKIESSIDLQSTLVKMGMSDMFTDNANFTGISDKAALKVSKILQKAFIEVNEEGSEAAAATVAVIETFSLPIPPPSPIIFNIDKPFMYAIVHHATNTVLFQGHVKLPIN